MPSMALVYVAGIERGDALSGDWSTMMTLATLSRPRISPKPLSEMPSKPWNRTSWTRVLLPEPETPVTHDEDAERDADVEVLEVVLVGVADLEEGLGRPPRGRHGDLLLAANVLGGERVAVAQEGRPGPLEDDLAAGLAGARPHVDDVLGGPDDVRVVLDDDDGVADILERTEDLDEAVVVAGMEADATARRGRRASRRARR